MTMPVRIGVLALQGDYAAHAAMLSRIADVEPCLVRDIEDLDSVSGLIIPGGESTTIGKLLDRTGLADPIRERVRGGMPLFGTCAGMILMAREIVGSDQPRLGLMDIQVERNAFGRQVDSFEADIRADQFGPEPLRGVFIRAPYVTRAGAGATVLAQYEGRIVAVREGSMLATAFHPELTLDTRVHRWFAEACRNFASGTSERGD
jgi:5'-phosphate synthase pdxT subunit